MLGFDSKVYQGDNESENIVNIMPTNSIMVNTNVIGGSYVNGVLRPTIYSFYPNVGPGYKIIEHPQHLIYLPILLDKIHSLEVSLTDQEGKVLNLRGEDITIRFHLREI